VTENSKSYFSVKKKRKIIHRRKAAKLARTSTINWPTYCPHLSINKVGKPDIQYYS